MKKMMKTLSLLTALALMVCSMSVVAFAADEDEDEGEGAAIVADEGEGEDEDEPAATEETAPINNTPVTTSNENPTTGAVNAPVAMMALAGVAAAGAVVASKKK